VLGVQGQFVRVTLEFGQIIERIGTAEFARVNQTHVNVADMRPVLRLIEQRILSVQDGLLDRLFTITSLL